MRSGLVPTGTSLLLAGALAMLGGSCDQVGAVHADAAHQGGDGGRPVAEDLGRTGYAFQVTQVDEDTLRLESRFGPAITPAGASVASMCRSAQAALDHGFEYFAVRAADEPGASRIELYHEPPEGWTVIGRHEDADVDRVGGLPMATSVFDAAAIASMFGPRDAAPVDLYVDRDEGPVVQASAIGSWHDESFLSGLALDGVRTITALPDEDGTICVAGMDGAVLATPAGEIRQRVSFARRAPTPMPLDVDGDGTHEYLNVGGGWSAVFVLEHDGRLRWMFPDDRSSGAPNRMAPFDPDGDGVAAFVVGMNGGGGVRVLGPDGAETARWDGSNVFGVAVADVDGDGRAEILHTSRTGLDVRDEHGELLDTILPGVNDFLVCTGPDGAPQIVFVRRGMLTIADLSGRELLTRRLEGSGHNDADIVWVRLDPARPPFLAAGRTIGATARRSEVFVWDPDGALVRHEEFRAAVTAVGAVPDGDGGQEALLVGAGDDVRRWTITW